ncbi:MAG TPA: NPCBM/NEW2 domain-containing protein, partial [Armatimonadota bacterium]|nr:NPCBM/NEW2 domain-containing protein [Armatimonadota bacterium]
MAVLMALAVTQVWAASATVSCSATTISVSEQSQSSRQDTIPPFAPTGLRAYVEGPNAVRLQWNAAEDNIGIGEYVIYRNGQEISRVISTEESPSCLDNRATPGKICIYRVEAVDFAGLKSRKSMPVVVSTPSPATGYITMLKPVSADGELRSVDNKEMSIAGKKYKHGIGTHADSEISYYLGGVYSGFSSLMGVDDEAKPDGSVVFKIIGDGQVLFESDVVKAGEEARSVSIDVSGVEVLTLVVTDAGDGTEGDYADWAMARLDVAKDLARYTLACPGHPITVDGKLADWEGVQPFCSLS